KKELEKSRVTTVGAGLGVGWGKNWFNLQGAAAVSDIYKESRASLNNTNINAGNAGAHPTINVTADTKSKINTVGAVGNISITGKVTGTVGLAINRMDQDTKAEMATDNGKTTAVNAGLTQVRATGDGDIHSVGVGATVSVGEYVTAAGSGSYNYIGNDVDAIIKNQNLASNSSVGVVAQSDDRLYNFAGGFNIGANTRAALGTSVSTNRITGSTNALVSGGSLAATNAGSIKVSRPKDDKIFKAEELTVAVTRDGLSSSRSDETKTGIVVDSSATHTIISQLSSGGVAASATVGLNLAGTVNINSIQAEKDKLSSTTAKIQDTNLNSAGNASDVNVNAVDYTNFGSFTGTPAVGAGAALGVSLGVSANWETYDRKTEAEISSSSKNAKKNIYAKNLTVDATAKHGSSALSFAAAAGGAKIGIASGDSIMRHKNTSEVSAKLDKVNAVFDGKAEVKAEHLGNSHTQNIAASVAAGMVAVAAGAGVSVMDDTSVVKAEVTDSELKAKNSGTGKDISVLAKNENNWKNTLVTASLGAGIGAGLAANVGIFNTTGETAALVTNSDLKAYNVNVNATDKLTAHGTGGVGAGGVGGVGVAVTLHNINSSVSSHVTGGSVEASNNIDVKAEETRSFDSQVTGVGAGGIGVGVNVAVISINKGITDAQLSSAKDENNNSTGVGDTTQNEINKQLNGYDTKDKSGKVVHVSGVNEAKGALGTDGAKFYGLNTTDKENLNTATNTSVSLATPTYDSSTPDTRKMGIHTEVGSTILKAGNNVNVTAKDTSDIFAKNIGVTAAGAASINVTDAIIHTNYDTDVTMNNATVTGKNVNINALQTQAQPKDGKQGSDVRVTAVTVGALGGVGVGYAGIVNRGSTDINIKGSTIASTGDVTINAKDESKHRSDILSVGVAALNVTTTFASVENYSNVGVALGGTNNISASNIITIDAKKANALEAHTQGVGVGGVNVAVNHATIEDGEKDKDGNIIKGKATAKITGTNGTFTANKFHLGAANDTTAKLSAGNVAVSILGISRMRGKGVMDMGAEVSVAGGNFNAKTAEFASMLGSATGRTIEGNVKGHNISVGAVAPDAVILNTTAAGTVNVQNSTFGENTDLILDNESYVDRKAYIYDVTVGGVAVGNSSADISGIETLKTTLTGKADVTNKLANLLVATYGENTGKALADAGGGGLVGYVGAHVDNKSTNTVSSTLGGKWETTGEVYVVAAQKDETRLTAKEGHGGVIGVGGTSVDNTIKTTANATVAEGTAITADRVHVGTGNAVTTGAYDDVDNKGNKDAQTYTLQDHFGGAISGNRLRSLLDITENGTVTIGKNAKITTNKLQEYIAASNNDLVNNASAKGGAAVGVTDAVTENILTINNKVNVNSGATLSNEKAASTEDIILAAYDEHKLKSHVEATVGGAVGVMVSKNINTMNRTSKVDVAGNIESSSNVGLYAGANEDGVLSNLNADLKAGAYNHTAIPISTPRVRYNKDGDDKDIGQDLGTVNVSGIVRSARDINAIASSGKVNVTKDQSLFNWVLGGSSTEKKF
ncbi:MAG: leukotoxin LktA like protein, partial [Succiniclasticum sp.]